MIKRMMLPLLLMLPGTAIAQAAPELNQAKILYDRNQFGDAYALAAAYYAAHPSSRPALYLTAISACRIPTRRLEGYGLLLLFAEKYSPQGAAKISYDKQLTSCPITGHTIAPGTAAGTRQLPVTPGVVSGGTSHTTQGYR